jgi:hypothetical protein
MQAMLTPCDVGGDDVEVATEGTVAPSSHPATTAMTAKTPRENLCRRRVRRTFRVTIDAPPGDG